MQPHNFFFLYDQYEEVERNSGGGVVMRKRYSLKNNIRDLGDSVVYVLIGPASLYCEYYEYEKNLCNKSTHYETYIDNGQPVTISYVYDFATGHDSNDNPVKQTIYFEGDKIAEITFTCSIINW